MSLSTSRVSTFHPLSTLSVAANKLLHIPVATVENTSSIVQPSYWGLLAHLPILYGFLTQKPKRHGKKFVRTFPRAGVIGVRFFNSKGGRPHGAQCQCSANTVFYFKLTEKYTSKFTNVNM